MYAEERHHWLVERARAVGRVEVTAVAAELGVSTETVRRDLSLLESSGLLRRVHGGAVPVERLAVERGLAARDAANADEKDRIAKAALAELPAEGAILIDAGTTTMRFAAALPHDRRFTVVTSSLPIAVALSSRSNLTVHVLGGRLRARTLAAVDDWALSALRQVTVDVAFLGTNGFSATDGLTTPDLSEAAVKRAMVSAGRRVVVLADHSKLGATHFARFAEMGEVDALVTDAGAEADDLAAVEELGVRVVHA